MLIKIKCLFGFHKLKRSLKIIRENNETGAIMSSTEPYAFCIYCRAMFLVSNEGYYVD